MQNLEIAKEVFTTINQKVIQSKFFTGIEIASYKKGNTYTDELCVRVLVNNPNVTHQQLNIPTSLNNIPIIIETRIIKPL
ncbi:hypothetical protein [Tenacibaculum sp. 190524A02b]|uniref:Uncharacterized protein n=1 Tax=Tenacibaculum vairaonense TaxID=3137860 RepID=A0ABM9PHF0_9FLAO